MSSARMSLFCCGDSITVGNFSTEQGGYRMPLFLKMQKRLGYSPRFVGSDSANSFIFNCMGVSGGFSANLAASAIIQSPLFPNTTAAIIHIGTNDMLGAIAHATITANVISVINSLRSNSPDITIWVAKIIDCNGHTAEVDAYNVSLTTAIQGIASYSSINLLGKTMLIDMNAVLGPYNVTNYGNGTHPNATGYGIMADGWYNQLATLF